MKKRLTVNVDAEVIPAAKRYARDRGVSLSSLVERSLRELAAEDGAAASDAEPTTAAEWEARRAAWFAGLRRNRRPAGPNADGLHDFRAGTGDEDSEEVARAWATRWRAWFNGELPPPRRSKDPRYRYLDEGLGKTYGIRWTEDDEPSAAEPPAGRDARRPGGDHTDDDRGSWLDRWLEQAGPPTGKLKPPTGDDPRYEYYWYKYRLWEGNEEEASVADDQHARATR